VFHLPHRRRLAVLLGAVLSFALTASAAPADERAKEQRVSTASARGAEAACPSRDQDSSAFEERLVDSSGLLWDLNRCWGYVDRGGVADQPASSAYDEMGYAYVAAASNDNDFDHYYNDGGTFAYEDGGRELVLPEDGNVNDTIAIERKVYVPATGLPFARFLNILRNRGASPVTFNYEWYGLYAGIDGVSASTDGDRLIDLGEPWAAFVNGGEDDENLDQASLWDGLGADDGWDRPFADNEAFVPGDDGEATVDYHYESVTLEPGEAAVFMHIEHQNRTVAGARAFAEAHGAGSREFFAGMSDEELALLRNWRADRDGDGVVDRDDTCAEVANAEQADLDRDGLGDACDDDVDGDGLSDADEGDLGLDPRKADTDGDGKADGLDRCGTRAGADADGCPVAATAAAAPPAATVFVPAPAEAIRRLRPNRVTATVRKTGPHGACGSARVAGCCSPPGSRLPRRAARAPCS
jgi:hypothetical protein